MVEFERILRDRGYRLTNQRRVIVRGLEGDRHLSAEEIYDRVKGENPEIGPPRSTGPWTSCTSLASCARRTSARATRATSWRPSGMHHHARCRECGAVIEFNEELMEYLALQVERETGFVSDWYEITLHGRCASCAAFDSP